MAPSGAPIVVEDLRRSYGAVEAIAGLSFTVEPGEVFALLGPNGAGKTTTVEILEGYRRRTHGHVAVLGRDPQTAGRDFRERVGIVLQSAGLDGELTVAETLKLYASCYAAPRPVDELLAIVDLDDLRRRRVQHLSGGERRRLELAVALVGDPDLIFLDEPTTALDPAARRRVWDIMAALSHAGRTILLTSHYMDEVQRLADRVLVVARGRAVAEGTPASLRSGHGAPTTISFHLPATVRLPDDLVALAHRQPPDLVVLETDEPLPMLHRITGWALERGHELHGLSVVEPSLEDVYLEITRDEDQEAQEVTVGVG